MTLTATPASYAHFMPDDDRAREIMNAFLTRTREGADHALGA
jgi:hypothetical protein